MFLDLLVWFGAAKVQKVLKGEDFLVEGSRGRWHCDGDGSGGRGTLKWV